jgi:dTDP-4-amino-4,6-dideoxygalactose transaminase
MPLTTYYRTRYGYRPGDFPVTDEVFARSLTLPLHEQLTDAEQRNVVDRLAEALAALGRP